MALSGERWSIGQAVRRALMATPHDHPLHRVYRALRRAPGARALWRSLVGAPSAAAGFAGVEAYAKAGGAFRETRPGAPSFGPPPEFDDARYFADLIARIRACETRYEPRPRTVLLVNNGLSAGGAERQIVYTLLGLKRRRIEAHFIGEYLGRAPGLDFHARTLIDAGVEPKAATRRAKPGDRLYAEATRPVAEALAKAPPDIMLEVLDMAAELRALRPAVVHLWQDYTAEKHAVAALMAGTPRIVLSGRNLNPTHFAYHRPEMRAAYRAFADAPEVVFSNNSAAGARSYAEWIGLPEDRIHVVRNGVDPVRWTRATVQERLRFRQSVGVAAGAPLVAGVLRLSPEKRPLLWLDTAARFAARRPDARFYLAGDGPMRDEVAVRIARPDLKDVVVWRGETPDVGLLLDAADLFLLTSAQEGTPNALIEAQWHGLSCAITEAGGAAETLDVGATGVVAAAAADPLSSALASLWDDGAFRENARRRGPPYVAERFGLDRMLDETLALYGFAVADRDGDLLAFWREYGRRWASEEAPAEDARRVAELAAGAGAGVVIAGLRRAWETGFSDAADAYGWDEMGDALPDAALVAFAQGASEGWRERERR